MAINESTAFYIVISLAAITSAAALLTLNAVAVAIASLAVLFSVIVFKLWDVVSASIFRHTNLIQVFNGYELSRDRQSAVFKAGGRVTATAVASLGPAGNDELDRKKIESIIANTDYPFRFCMRAERLNLKKALDRLKTRKSSVEIELSRIDQKSGRHTQRQNRLKRELEQLERDISSISGGEAPLKLCFYITTSASSDSIYDAEERAKSHARDLSSKFDALLGSKSEVLSGEELLAALKIDSMMI